MQTVTRKLCSVPGEPGVADVNLCLRNTFLGYNNPNLYKGLGPNSNTFAGTLGVPAAMA